VPSAAIAAGRVMSCTYARAYFVGTGCFSSSNQFSTT